MADINIRNEYLKRFGYFAPPFPAAGVPDPRNLIPGGSFIGSDKDKLSMLGQKIMLPVRLRIPLEGEEWIQLPNEPIMSINSTMEVERTRVSRGNKRGTVKEIINLDDYVINLDGLIINETEKAYPDDIISDMRRLMEHPGSLEIDSHITRLYNITLVVRSQYAAPRQDSDKLRVQRYNMQFWSDEEFELELQ